MNRCNGFEECGAYAFVVQVQASEVDDVPQSLGEIKPEINILKPSHLSERLHWVNSGLCEGAANNKILLTRERNKEAAAQGNTKS